jgi:hypothetical protein
MIVSRKRHGHPLSLASVQAPPATAVYSILVTSKVYHKFTLVSIRASIRFRWYCPRYFGGLRFLFALDIIVRVTVSGQEFTELRLKESIEFMGEINRKRRQFEIIKRKQRREKLQKLRVQFAAAKSAVEKDRIREKLRRIAPYLSPESYLSSAEKPK